MPYSRSRRPAKRIFKHETLEPRHMMSGDGLGVGLAAADETVQTATDASTQAANFESLDALRQWITAEALQRYGELFGTTQTRPDNRFFLICGDVFDFDGLGMPVSNFVLSASDAVEFSTTNTQVAGVDEADLVETDGEFVYLLSGKELIIVDARDPDDLQIASRVALEDQPTGMYLDGDRLTLVSSSQANYYGGGLRVDSLYWGGGTQVPPIVTVTVLDVSDRSAPTQVEQTEIDGTLLSSRLVDGQLRLVTQQNANRNLPSPNYTIKAKEVAVEGQATSTLLTSTTESLTIAGNAIVDRYYPSDYEYIYETLDEYVDRVVAQWAPGYRTLSADGEVIDSGFLVDPTELEIPAASEVNGYGYRIDNHVSVMTFNTRDETAGPTDTLVLQGASNGVNLHGTTDGLYVFSVGRTTGPTNAYIAPHVVVTKLSFSADGAIKEEASGRVDGTLPNQFAADEHDGYLRVVTATGGWRSGDQRLTVLEEVGGQLVEVGAINSLAPGEMIHSVRFQGEEAFVVTFRRVDPLFAIDLSDPASPTVEGELKIPGFSNYLHPFGEDHLLGLGRDADERTGRIGEMQVSIFEVGDLTDPELIHRHTIGEGENWASSAVGGGWTSQVEHHAFSYFEEEGVLALPVQNSAWVIRIEPTRSTSETPGLQPGDSGLLVMSIDVTAGISEVALIEHETPIQRSLRIGDTLIAISSGQVSTHDFGDLDGELDRLDFAAANATRPGAYIPTQRESLPAEPTEAAEPADPVDPATSTDPAASTGLVSEPISTPEPTEPEATPAARVSFVPVARESLTSRVTDRAFARTSHSPAARDAALLLIDQAMATEEDSEVAASFDAGFDTGFDAESDDETSAMSAERGTRSAWRPMVRGF